ncbi:MAG: carnitine dehydratase [Fluviicola sp.]|nr:MAG: carnitine dehydratase [Fluviicola sp.]
MNHYSVFQNLNIIDLSTVLAGPSVGSFFAELGANVVKIEHPEYPDATRSWKLESEPKDVPISAYFSSINYKKKYLQLDLKQKKQYERFLELIATADIVLMNFKKGGQEKLNITDKQLRLKNKGLIIGKISGFGDESDRVAYDLILQAESGFMSMNGTPESGPVKMPIALIDVLAAHHLKEGILIELLQRERLKKDYKGSSVSVSLYDAAVSSLVNQASNYLMTDKVPERIGSLHPNIAPYGEIFTTKDGKSITFAIGSNRHFEILCSFLELEEMIKDTLFKDVQSRVKNRAKLYRLIEPKVKEKEANFILNYMNKNHVPAGAIKNLKEVFETKNAQNLIREEMISGVKTKRVTGIAFKTK